MKQLSLFDESPQFEIIWWKNKKKHTKKVWYLDTAIEFGKLVFDNLLDKYENDLADYIMNDCTGKKPIPPLVYLYRRYDLIKTFRYENE